MRTSRGNRGVSRLALVGLVALVAVVGAGCSSRHAPSADRPTARTRVHRTPSATPRGTCPASPRPGPSRNLVVTDTLRHQLLAAGAALNKLPPSDYQGLEPGLTYAGYHAADRTMWAAAALAAKPTSTPALVAGQDAGSYLLFWRQDGGRWHVLLDGGGLRAPACRLPPSLLRVWGWPPGSEHPPPPSG